MLDCIGDDSEPCEVVPNSCTYYSLGKYRIIFDRDWGIYASRYPYHILPADGTVELDYDKHSPARQEIENSTDNYRIIPGNYRIIPGLGSTLNAPEYVSDLLQSVKLRTSVFDTEKDHWFDRRRDNWSYSEFLAYRALVSPKVTYRNTPWGKMRKQGDSTYVWHVLSLDKYEEYWDKSTEYWSRVGHPEEHPWSFFSNKKIDDWDPEEPIDWQPGEKEAYDALAEEVSLSLPLSDDWETYDLEFIFGKRYHRCCGLTEGWARVDTLSQHLRRSFTEAKYDTTRYDTRLKFKN